MTHLFLGLTAEEWASAEGWPTSPYGDGEPLSIELVKAGVAAMLRQLDDGTFDLDLSDRRAT